ncbi:hypothetical protein TWF281_000215 [Arthrobotrys megalospora]
MDPTDASPSQKLVIHDTPLTPQASIIKLSPEVIFPILEYLDYRDVFSVLLTCKVLYPIAYQHLWSTLEFSTGPNFTFTHHGLPPSAWRKLERMYSSAEAGSLDLGWRFTRTLALHHLSVLHYKELTEMLGELFRIDGSLYPEETGEEFLKILKTYYSSKPPGEVILSIPSTADRIFLMEDVLDFRHLSDLRLMNDRWEKGTQEVTWEQREDKSNPTKRITNLTKLLSTAVNLRHLSLIIFIQGSDDEEQAYYINDFQPNQKVEESPESLAMLQKAFSKLDRLETLEIENFFVDRSFFLTPPANVKAVKFRCTTTPTWWRQLLQFDLPGVEDLTVYHEMRTACWESWRVKRDYEGFETPSVAFTTLKRFSGRAPLYTPHIAKYIVEANKELHGRHDFKEDWGDEIVPGIEECAERLVDAFASIVRRNVRSSTWKDLHNEDGLEIEARVAYFAQKCLSNMKDKAAQDYPCKNA